GALPRDPPIAAPPLAAVGAAAPADLAPERFVLRDPTPHTATTPFILPDQPWFALSDLKLDDPAACGNTEQVCAANRSLNTALTWAKSPAEAAETARHDGKLVFLIHVSGNFENPGFT